MTPHVRSLDRLFESVSLGAPENAIGFVLWRLVHRYQRELDAALAPMDLTHLQFQTLTLAAWMERSGAPATQSGLARSGDIHPMQVSQVLAALEAKGLVKRTRDALDVRAKRVAVTPEAVKSLRRALPAAIAVQQRLFGEEGKPGGPLLATLLRLLATEEPAT